MTKRKPTEPTTAASMRELARGFAEALAEGRAELDALLERIDAPLGGSDRDWDARWEAVQRVIEGDAPLYRLRYKTLGAFIGAHLAGESPRSVQRNALVAGCFTQADQARHGVAWLEAAALYAQAAAGAERPPKAIDLDRLKVAGKRARDCGLAELRAARKKLEGGAMRTKAGPREAALRAALARRAALRGVTVSARAEGVGLGAIPWEALRALGAVLAKVTLPEE